MKLKFISLFLLFFTSTVYLWSGQHLQFQVKQSNGQLVNMDLKSQASALLVASDESNGDLLYKKDSNKLLIIDHNKKEVTVIDKQMLQKVGSQMNAAFSQMQSQLEGMDPAQRAMIEQMMQQHMPNSTKKNPSVPLPIIKFKLGNDSKEIQGQTCKSYEVFKDNQKVFQGYIAPWESFKGGKNDFESLLSLKAFMFDLQEELMNLPMVGSSMQKGMFEFLKVLDTGLPFETVEIDGGDQTSLVEIKHQDFDSSIFEVPKGYSVKSPL